MYVGKKMYLYNFEGKPFNKSVHGRLLSSLVLIPYNIRFLDGNTELLRAPVYLQTHHTTALPSKVQTKSLKSLKETCCDKSKRYHLFNLFNIQGPTSIHLSGVDGRKHLCLTKEETISFSTIRYS